MNAAIMNAMDPAAIEAAGLALGTIFLLGSLTALLRYLLPAIGFSKMYRKAGVAGWKAFIPVYNIYNNYKISWNGKLFFLYAALFLASTILSSVAEGAMGLVAMAISIGLVFMVVKQNVKMAKRFGKGAGTGIALILFPGITSLILGLGKAEYIAE